ncbi:MAG: toxin-antitoxin system YwqK family antitoxin [Fusobacterium sp.]|nr:toxin-antitoxin system YwqK family antitoxin [Fusobacterium sp.]
MNFKKKLVLSIFLLFISNIYADTFKEIKLLDDYSREILGEPTRNVVDLDRLQKQKQVKMENFEKRNNDNKQIQKKVSSNIRVSADDIVDIYEKTSENDIVYKIGDSKPFTGFFGIVLDGKIEYYEQYKNGLLDGETAWFSRETGVKLLSEPYTRKKLNGEQKTFYDNGKLKSIVYYKNNRIDGLATYDESGNVLHKSIFKNGTGTWKFFWSNGNVLEEGRYTSWRKDGTWKRYAKDGRLEKVTVYNNGRLVSQSWK